MCKNTVDDEQVMIPSCGAILSHFRVRVKRSSGEDAAAKTSVQKCGCPPPSAFFNLCHPLDL